MRPAIAAAVLVVILSCLMSGCVRQNPPVSTGLALEFILNINQTAIFEEDNLTITFDGIKEDSRCPVDAECITAGKVTAVVSFAYEEEEEDTGTLELTLDPSDPDSSSARFEKYEIRFLRLFPDRYAGRDVNPLNYAATFIVFSQIHEIEE